MKSKRKSVKKNKGLSEKYTLTVAGYYDNESKPDEIVKITAALVDIRTDCLVELLEINCNDPNSLDFETFLEKHVSLAKKYDAKVIILDKSVPLELCKCGCGGYEVRLVTKADLMNFQNFN